MGWVTRPITGPSPVCAGAGAGARAPGGACRSITMAGACGRPNKVMAKAPAAIRQIVNEQAKLRARPLRDVSKPSAVEAAAAMPPLRIGMVTHRLTQQKARLPRGRRAFREPRSDLPKRGRQRPRFWGGARSSAGAARAGGELLRRGRGLVL